MTDLVAGTAVYVQLTRTGSTTTDATISASDFFIACARSIDKSGKTVTIRGVQYDLDTLAFVNQ